ncbi:precorrin-6A reductase [Priestia koreensis]|uniref:Precorrin-6x reductase n=1 Tax=Priestia koreensis TaxID=284581 RepID=A0A0M0L692_9BACI|nr:precorrin-6A reductase [Priestia koreensis]KOO46549.1 precorrin-6x reductase [Priestia koreensis]
MILCLAGTSDARELARKLKQAEHSVLATVVTENAAIELKNEKIPVRVGRLTAEEMEKIIQDLKITLVVDASHPFAEEASKNAIAAAANTSIPYIRYERAHHVIDDPLLQVVESYEKAAKLAALRGGTVMLTTGSKTLQVFTNELLHLPNVKLIARMLPRKDNMEKCEQLGLPQKHIIAIQGPFTKEFDQALYKQYGVTTMITKESGKVGSVDQKLEAAKDLGIHVIVIKRPDISYGNVHQTFEDVLTAVHQLSKGEK